MTHREIIVDRPRDRIGSHYTNDRANLWRFDRTYPAGLTETSRLRWLERHQDAIVVVVVVVCGIVALLVSA